MLSKCRARGSARLRVAGIVILGTLILAIPPASQSQSPDSQTIFPSDNKTPQQAGAAELLEAVCPGLVTKTGDIGCKGDCPPESSFAGDTIRWTLGSVTFGHFLSPTSDDAVLWMEGCEPHSYNFGATILLTRKSQQWSKLWYKPGVQTARCHKLLRRDRREVLVCIGSEGGQGISVTSLYVEDFSIPSLS